MNRESGPEPFASNGPEPDCRESVERSKGHHWSLICNTIKTDGFILESWISMSAYIYILRLKSGNLYIGTTLDLNKRVQEHMEGSACRTTCLDSPLKPVLSGRGGINHPEFLNSSPFRKVVFVMKARNIRNVQVFRLN